MERNMMISEEYNIIGETNLDRLRNKVSAMLAIKRGNFTRKELMGEGITKYLYIKNNLSNGKYKDVYRVFYGLARIGKTFCENYFKEMERLKADKDKITFKTIFEAISKERNETSFASKMLHTFKPEFPIWDRIVATDHFGMKVPNKAEKEIVYDIYEKYVTRFNEYKSSDSGKELINIFNEICDELFDENFLNENKPKTTITDTKKIDFLLWCCRPPKKPKQARKE